MSNLLMTSTIKKWCFANKQAAQMTEVYWMALARDVPFTKFATDPLAVATAGKRELT